MKKSLLALAVLGAFAGAASAQTSVTVYGKIDLGLTKTGSTPTAMNNGDNSRLGFKGTEDLGGGLSANFQLEQRFDADTGTNENGNRPLFQGASWVGLSSTTLGAIRLGRALTPFQAYGAAFDPWGLSRNRGALLPYADAGYVSDPLNRNLTAQNRWSNAVYYTSPTFAGFKFDAAVATKEGGLLGGEAYSVPFSLAGGYNNGPISAMAAYERNAVNQKIWRLGGGYDFGVAKLVATYAKTKHGNTIDPTTISAAEVAAANTAASSTTLTSASIAGGLSGVDAKGWSIGGLIPAGPGRVLAGFAQTKVDASNIKAKKASLGYEYPLSKRTFLYTDYVYNKVDGSSKTNTFDIGVDHSL